MKLTTEITELLFELSDIESSEHTQLLIGDGSFLRHNLVTLYGKTANPISHDIIIEIMDKCGYPLFEPHTNQDKKSVTYVDGINNPDAADMRPRLSDEVEFYLSEDEFLDLLPVNGYFH